ncbi:MAG: penicillin-binding protein activator [Desulforhabdus sp.]|jgi:ABC-type branched-subunit amino acid transport system substrate-binding protein|nr:penicillin-binding protein activator [Desulforhabdus sp.]
MKRNGCWVLVVLAVVLLSNCAPVQRTGPALIPSSELHKLPPPEAKALLEKAEQQQKAGNLNAAIASWEQIAQSYPNNAVAAEAFYRLGEAFLREGDSDRALQYFDYLLYSYPQWQDINLAAVGRLQALWLQGQKRHIEKEAIVIWNASPQNPEVQFKVSQLMVAVSRDKGDLEEGFDWAAAGFRAAKTEQQKKTLTKATVELLQGSKESTIQRLLQRNPDDFMRLFLDYRMAQIQLEKQPSDVNREALYSLLQRNPKHPLAMEIQTTLRGTTSEVTLPLNANRIGSLLPLNGPYRKYGSSVLRGIAMAEQEWNRTHPDQQVTVIVKDTQAEPELARKSFESLAKNEGVLAIVGPLGVKSAKAVFPDANKWNMPLLALSQKDEDTGNNPYVLHAFLDNRELVQTLVDFCRERLDYTKFATLYPNDRYGQRLSKDFAEAVQEKGGDLLASVAYEPDSNDFKAPIQKLIDTAKKNSPPSGLNITPFEALFIPDQVQTVALIAPQLPYYNVVGATLLGTNLWEEESLAQAGGAYVENALFATPFFPDSNVRETQSFRQKYESIYRSPPTYLEAQAYDALMLLLHARSMLPPSAIDRASLLQSLLQISNYPGVTGTYTVTPDGKISRNYLVLQITNGRMIQVYP